MKKIERLRYLRSKAVERLETLAALVKTDNRELTIAEQDETAAQKLHIAELDTQINEALAAENTGSDLAKLNAERAIRDAAARGAKEIADLQTNATRGATARATSILSRCRAAGLDSEFAGKLIADEALSADQASDSIFAELAKTKPEGREQQPTGASVTREQRDTSRQNMTAALLHRIDSRQYPLKEAAGREFMGMTLLEMAKESLAACGVRVRGLSRDQIVSGALFGRNWDGAGEIFAGMHSTSDFPNIMADVANKRLRQAYEAAPRTFQPFCRQTTAPDFKNVNAVQLSDMSVFQKLNEHGEFASGTLADSKETYKLATYGEILRITRKTIINDDTRALDRVPAAMGTAAARLENETVWGIITANAAMADGVTLFHSTHGNSLTGAGSALALAGLGPARAAMRKQPAPKGQILNLIPAFLMAPAALEITGSQLLAPLQLFAGEAGKVIPEFVRNITLIIEPLLDASSAAFWYLAANPSRIDTIEYCYLEGQEGVNIETRNGFEVEGVEIKARLDFAAAAIDHRGLLKNAGA